MLGRGLNARVIGRGLNARVLGRDLNARFFGKGLNANVLGRGLKLLRANCGKFEINQILIADDATLVPDSEDKLCRLLSVFGIACESKKVRMNVHR